MGTTKTSSEVRLEVQDDTAAQVFTIHLGPINLPANSDHTTVHQAPDFFFDVPFDGWITAYHPRLQDGAGQPSSSRLLHHVAYRRAWAANHLISRFHSSYPFARSSFIFFH